MADLAKLVDELSALTVMEAADLSKMLEENGAFLPLPPLPLLPVVPPVVPLLPKKKTSLISFWLKLVPTRSTSLKKSALSPSWV